MRTSGCYGVVGDAADGCSVIHDTGACAGRVPRCIIFACRSAVVSVDLLPIHGDNMSLLYDDGRAASENHTLPNQTVPVPAENLVLTDSKGLTRFALREPIRYDVASQNPN